MTFCLKNRGFYLSKTFLNQIACAQSHKKPHFHEISTVDLVFGLHKSQHKSKFRCLKFH